MPQELIAKKTPVSNEEFIKALYGAWVHYFNSVPKKESIWCLASQWALETGWGKSMWNFNIGNVKSTETDGRDYCYFACNEILKKAVAEKYVDKNPDTAKITKYRDDGTAIIWFYPKHPGCRFRAFNTLLEGCIDYIALLNTRYEKSWPAISEGNPEKFAHLLKLQGYYTADESSYANNLKSIFKTFANLKVDYDAANALISEEEKARIINLVLLTAKTGV